MCKVCTRLISAINCLIYIHVINHLLYLANILLFTELNSEKSTVYIDNKRDNQCEYHYIYTVVTPNMEICPSFSLMYGTIPHTGVGAVVVVIVW